MLTTTTTSCILEGELGLSMASGTTRNRPVKSVVTSRPRKLAMVAEFWCDKLSALARTTCASTPFAPHRLQSRQYRNSRSSLCIQCVIGSARDRGGRSGLKSLVSYISGNVRSVRALAAFSSSNSEHRSMVMRLLKASSASSAYSVKILLSE